MSYKKKVLLCVVYVLVSVGVSSQAIGAILPVAMDLGNQKTVSGQVYFQYDCVDYGVPMDVYVNIAQTPLEQFSVRVLDTIRKQDKQQAMAMAFFGQSVSQEQQNQRLDWTLSFLGQYLQATDSLKVVQQAQIQNRRIFFLEQIIESGKIVLPILLIQTKNGVYWDFSKHEDSLTAMIRDSLHAQANTSQLTEDVTALDFGFTIPLLDSKQPHAVYLLFNGHKYASSPLMTINNIYDQAAAMLWARYILVHAENIDAADPLYVDDSTFRLTEICKNPTKYGWLERKWKQIPDVFFVMDASPVYVVFCKTSKSFTHEILIRGNDTEGMKFTDPTYKGFFTQLLSSDEFKDEFQKRRK